MHIEQRFGVAAQHPSTLRIRYYNIQRDRFSWRADRSDDDGKTWSSDDQQIEARRIGPPRSLGPLAPAASVSSFGQTGVDIRARRIESEGSVTRARGEVEINTETVRLNADEVDFHSGTNQAEVRGHVRVKFLPDVPNPRSSIPHYLRAEKFLKQNNYQSAANEFREALNGDMEPGWTQVWSRVSLGKIFDITGQRERAVNEYEMAERTGDNTRGALEEASQYLKSPYQGK